MTIPDPHDQGRAQCPPYEPASALTDFNDRIRELVGEENVQLVDDYQIMLGHPQWWVQGDRHPNNDGHAAIAKAVEEKFGVYHPVTPSPTVTSKASASTPVIAVTATATVPATAQITLVPTVTPVIVMTATVSPQSTK